jgi:hypothetical protein
MAPRRIEPTRPEMLHENPIVYPFLVAQLRTMAGAILNAPAAPMPEGFVSSGDAQKATQRALAAMLNTWADQIEAFHADRVTEAAADALQNHG